MAKRKAAASGSRPFSREPAADTPSSSGPPKIQLPGGKPSWREREAMKAAGQTPPAASTPPAPAAASPAAEAEAPKRGGYVPPALRQGGAPGGGWREREASGGGSGSGRFEAARGGDRWGDRKASPATTGGYVPPGARRDAAAREGEGESESRPAAQAPAASTGKYVPRHLRDRQ